MGKKCDVLGGGPSARYVFSGGEDYLRLGLDGAACIPGCYPAGRQCGELGSLTRCSSPPHALCAMIAAWEDQLPGTGPLQLSPSGKRFTEVIVDASSVVEAPVAAIDGFFLMDGAPAAQNNAVRAAHADFTRRYGLDRDRAPPLVVLDPTSSPPFRMAEGPG